VVQPGHGSRLALEPPPGVALLHQKVRVKHLHRHFALQRGVEAPVDDTHAARPQEFEQSVTAQLATGEAHASLDFQKRILRGLAVPQKSPARRR
jgi:hypothetical protein